MNVGEIMDTLLACCSSLRIVSFTVPAMTICSDTAKGRNITSGWVGGYVTNQRPWNAAKMKERGWRDHVQWAFRQALVRRHEHMPTEPHSAKGWTLFTRAYFKSKVHADPCNVHKAIEDALVGRIGSSPRGRFFFAEDKNLAGYFDVPHYDKKNPRVQVWLVKDQEKNDD